MSEEQTKSAFTPGPWEAHGCEVVGSGFIVATVNWHSGHNHERANARLIAAAPDLYEALQDCAAVCAGETMSKGGLVAALEKARDALARATPEGTET